MPDFCIAMTIYHILISNHMCVSHIWSIYKPTYRNKTKSCKLMIGHLESRKNCLFLEITISGPVYSEKLNYLLFLSYCNFIKDFLQISYHGSHKIFNNVKFPLPFIYILRSFNVSYFNTITIKVLINNLHCHHNN